MLARPAILELFGINYWSYPDEDRAVLLADEKIAKNRMDHPWILEKLHLPQYADIISEVDPKAGSEFFYVYYQGLSRAQQVTLIQEYNMEGDPAKKPVSDANDDFMDNEMGNGKSAEEKAMQDNEKKLANGVAKVDSSFKDLMITYL